MIPYSGRRRIRCTTFIGEQELFPAPNYLVRFLVMMALAVFAEGCHRPVPTSDAPSPRSPVSTAVARSVAPGINDPYRDADVDEWIERFETESREIFQHRGAIAEAVGIRPGSVVADIGAGTGLFTLLFAEKVGPTGKVLAVDIVPEFIALIRTRARERELGHVQTVFCAEDSVLLSPGSIDLAFVCDTYHHFEFPRSTLASIHRALKPGGEFVVIDFERFPDKSREWVLDHVRAGKEVVTGEICTAGFEPVEQPGLLPELKENYFLRFRKKP